MLFWPNALGAIEEEEKEEEFNVRSLFARERMGTVCFRRASERSPRGVLAEYALVTTPG